MRLYTFYCCHPDGSAPSFEAHDMPTDEAAVTHAGLLLDQHASCSSILVYEADREVGSLFRDQQPLGEPAPKSVQGERPFALTSIVDAAAAIPEVAVIATIAGGEVVYWSEGAVRLYGWEAGEALGRDILDLTPALQSREEAGEIMATLQSGQPWEGEIILRKRDGTPFKAFVTDIASPDGAVIVGISAKAGRRQNVLSSRAAIMAALEAPSSSPA